MKVSVVVPAYNAEKTINTCLTALVGQTYPHGLREIIVVDDGSTDSTADIVGRYPVRLIRQSNKGPASARNAGANTSTGEIIMFTDSDCAPEPDWIEQMLKPFANPAVCAVKGAYKSNQPQLTARFSQVEFEERFELLKRAESIDMVDTYSAAFRREVFVGAGGFDESFPSANNEDTDLSYKLSLAGKKMAFNPDAIVYHMGHPACVERYLKVKFWRGYWRMVVYERYPKKMVKDTYTPQSLKAQVALVYGAIAVLAAGVFIPWFLWLTAAILGAFIATTVPFAVFAARRDLAVGVVSPFYLALRALAIGGGVLYYTLTRKSRAGV
jgi:glycosyltransferase involved in cell wall biosynthesis